eukprot:CAMPEP_0113272718 /NCGR_PEP_ID=MMETSP0008_2-20120614/23471_2 /TAXON_ID=97485 /ORGANISM="Prymnesium parvum" /LENGTH=32 /DNA_ID=CAMNT_0000122195 /DNA_START=626 /DNA_END=720 /DNA_ORIENTATION=- /assembly_acc=CAM_ASM_000153
MPGILRTTHGTPMALRKASQLSVSDSNVQRMS